jgi:NAD(P)H-dependent flavin oxidoreductase YrpB (nitropropane dioxygenase family)
MSSLCDLLSIRHPIMQSGMGRVAGPELAAEVSRAGGLGILAGLNSRPTICARRFAASVRLPTPRSA